MSKKQNNAIWKIQDRDDHTPQQLIDYILTQYKKRIENEPGKYAGLREVALNKNTQASNISLYIRTRNISGIYDFAEDILASSVTKAEFSYYSKDTCLFIKTNTNLYVVTSGSGYHIIEDFVDYSYPFDIAKKLIANSFKAAQKRQLAGSALSVDEKYRRDITIDKTKNIQNIWKSLIGKIDTEQLPDGNFIKEIIDLEKPPTVEIKSSFSLKKRLSLNDMIRLVKAIESLPEPSEEHKKNMEFLDCLQPVKGSSLKRKLNAHLKTELLLALRGERTLDFDICDPNDFERYITGSAFEVGRVELGDERPDIEDVIVALGKQLKEAIEDDEQFAQKMQNIRFKYQVGDDGQQISLPLLHTVHGQVVFEGETYFLIDKNWYLGQGDYLNNLIDDFIACVFEGRSPLFSNKVGEVELISWDKSWDEDKFNREQAKRAGFYLGDKIFFQRGYGKIEIFDLLHVDKKTKTVHFLHVKDDFDAKVRDVCSQIEIARDVIDSFKRNTDDFKKYYKKWSADSINLDVDEATFLSWFDTEQYAHTFTIVCSTGHEFAKEEFQENKKLQSYVAKREIIITKEDFRGKDKDLRLMHVRKVTAND